MENKNILEFIEKLQSAISGKNNEKSENKEQNSADNNAPNPPENKSADQSAHKRTSVSVFPSYAAGENDGKSYLKSYNPFGEAMQNRPQVSAPRAKKQPKEKIDLSSSKNLAADKKTEVSKNMVDLINKHNRISEELKKRGN